MAWFAVHSALTLALAFVTGLLVGWLVWGLRWVRAEERTADRPDVAAASDAFSHDLSPDRVPAGRAVSATGAPSTEAVTAPAPPTTAPASVPTVAPTTAAPVPAPTGFEPAAVEHESFDLRRQPIEATSRNGSTVTALLPSPSVSPDTAPMAARPGSGAGPDDPDAEPPGESHPAVPVPAAPARSGGHHVAPNSHDPYDAAHLDEEGPEPHGGEPVHPESDLESTAPGLVDPIDPPPWPLPQEPHHAAAIAPTHSTTVDDETTGAAVNARPPGDSRAATDQGADPAEADPALMDDLTLIDGVTPQMAAALATEGIGSFFAVANASEDQLRRALRVNRIRSAPGIAFWATKAAELVEQAQAARTTAPADGDSPAEGAATGPAPQKPAPAADAAPPTAPLGMPPTVPPTVSSTVPATAATTPARRPVPGAAFRTTARPEGPSWTSVAPAAEEDLERIHGVDAAIAAALHAAGVTNYTQLAAVRDEELRQILADADLTDPPTLPTWSVQAALLLQGDSDGAATLAGGLMIGRENS